MLWLYALAASGPAAVIGLTWLVDWSAHQPAVAVEP